MVVYWTYKPLNMFRALYAHFQELETIQMVKNKVFRATRCNHL